MGDQLRIDEDDGVAEWEAGLPSADQLASLSLSLIPADLASAFRILPEPLRTADDVDRASQSTLTSLRDVKPVSYRVDDCCEVDEQEGSDPKKSRVMNPIEEQAGGDCMDDQSTDVAEKAVNKLRLVWTPQLHKRFVEVVAHLGLKNAVPKTIMQLMNVEGLTRENVASHLQKYRLYVKRMQGWSDESSPSSNHLFASSEATSNGGGPIHGNGNENRLRYSGESGNHEASNGRIPTQMPYPLPPHFTPIPIMAMAAESVNSGYHGIQQKHNNMIMMQQQRDWPGNMYNSHPYHAMNQNQK
ncbi:transcription factor PCL1-like [Primulina huaijiensis]|uniref:transcription factor PCL1-like n=1 Tax=Primulina huaijiensis TaxID=1492673 RepID=UPI003CC6FAC6